MILNGKNVAEEILEELASQIAQKKQSRAPTLAYLLIGDHPASHIYVRSKVKACEKIGIETRGHCLEKEVSQEEVLNLLFTLNQDPSVDGILVQLPLPPQLNTQEIIESVDPQKDVDGFHPFNMGRLLLGHTPYFIACTPLGIQELLKRSAISTKGKHIVIVGRSNIVGKPLAALLVQKHKHANATVTLAHSYTQDLEKITSKADILIAAMGSPEFIHPSMVKKGAVVIDVGMNRHHGKLVGDVHFEKVSPICSYITPVPKGVGPMTIAMLLSNTFKAYCQNLA